MHFHNNFYALFLVLFFFNAQALCLDRVPSNWIVTPEKELAAISGMKIEAPEEIRDEDESETEQRLESFHFHRWHNENITGFEESIEKMTSASHRALDSIQPKNSSSWALYQINNYISVEPNGSIGFLGLRGAAAIDLYWQHILYKNENTTSSLAGSPPKNLHIDEHASDDQLESEVHTVLVAASTKTPIEDLGNAKQIIVAKAKEIRELAHALSQNPIHDSWWVNGITLDVSITPVGKVLFFLQAGVNVRFRLVWQRIKPKNAPITPYKYDTSLTHPAVAFISELAKDLETFEKTAWKHPGYEMNQIMLSIGLSLNGTSYIAALNVDASPAIFLKKDKPAPFVSSLVPNTQNLPSSKPEENFLWMKTHDTPTNRELIKRLGSSVIESAAHPTEKVPMALYLVNRDLFRKSLERSARIGYHFVSALQKRKAQSWILQTVGMCLSMSVTGGIGIVNLSQREFIELFFERVPSVPGGHVP